MDQQKSSDAKEGEVRVIFFHLVVLLETLDAKLPGGSEAFLDRFQGARTECGLAVWCVMAGQDIDPMVTELEANNLSEDDFLVGVWDGMCIGPPGPEEIIVIRPWLQGRIVGGDMWVSRLV